MKPVDLKKSTLIFLCIIGFVFGIAQVYFWFLANYQAQKAIMDSWAQGQTFHDPKWSWDASKIFWVLLAAVVVLVVAWKRVHEVLIRPWITRLLYRGKLGPLYALCAGGVLFGGLAFVGNVVHFMVIQAINDPMVSGEATWAWLTGPAFNGRLSLPEFTNYICFIFFPRTLLFLLGIGSALSAMIQTASYKPR